MIVRDKVTINSLQEALQKALEAAPNSNFPLTSLMFKLARYVLDLPVAEGNTATAKLPKDYVSMYIFIERHPIISSTTLSNYCATHESMKNQSFKLSNQWIVNEPKTLEFLTTMPIYANRVKAIEKLMELKNASDK